ncbi:MAG: phenylacetate-CoA ligase [Blastocatellia bacterium]|jgi:phenylacetate-CoA ligase|nr:phenylacetate-CoA ligase [Blastocatellia bacterium]
MDQFHFYDRELETLTRQSLRRLQDQKLVRLIKELATNRFYTGKFQAAGINLADVKGFADLQGALPFTTKDELVQEQQARPPFGGLLTYEPSRYLYFHQTSGTTGSPLKWLDTREDWETWMRCWACVYRGAGVGADDKVFCAFSFGPYVSHWSAIGGARFIGALSLAGGGMNSEQRLRTLIDNRCTVLVSTPTYALHLAQVARECGINLSDSAVRLTIHAGEPGASVPNVRKQIEAAWGARCYDHAGATEVGAWAFDCEAQDDAIHLNEAEFIFELIEIERGAVVSLEDALAEEARGELVITNLGRAGMPVLRYRTGDLVELTVEPCACGRSFARIKGGVIGRADDMLIVRGVNLYPSAIDNLLRSLPQIIEYEVTIRRLKGLDDLLIKIEADDAQPFAQIELAIKEAFRAQFALRVTIEQAPRDSLPRYEFKARRYKREEPEARSQEPE